MSTMQPPEPGVSRRGRGLIISGAVLLTVSILGGILGTVLTVGQFDGSELNDVAIDGATNPAVPGKLTFRVLEPLHSDGPVDDIRVGIAVDYTTLPLPECTMQDSEGTPITLSAPTSEEQLLTEDSADLKILGSALLQPGSYEAICNAPGEPSSSDATFTVGRVFGFSDLRGAFAPILWFLAIGAIAALMFVLGLILLIVGLVRRSKAKRDVPPTPYGPGGYGPGGYGPGGYGPAGYGPGTGPGYPPNAPQGYPPASGPQGYPPEAYPPPAPPAPPWPAPHAPGPPGSQPAAPDPRLQPPEAPGSPPPSAPEPPPPASPPTSPEAETHSGWTIPPSKKQQ